MLLGESSAGAGDGWVAVLITGSSILGGGIVWLANYLTNRRAQQRVERKEDERGIVEHQNRLNARLEARIATLEEESSAMRRLINRALAHIGYLEGQMEAKGMTFKRFSPDDGGSDHHAALTPPAPNAGGAAEPRRGSGT